MADRRSEPRYRVFVEAVLREGGDAVRKVEVVELSPRGCRVASPRREMGVGSYLKMTLGPVGFIDACVVWQQGKIYGIRFEQPLHPAVVEHVRTFLSAGPSQAAKAAGGKPGQAS